LGAGLPQNTARLKEQPVGAQHAIGAGHGLGVHVVPPIESPPHCAAEATIEHAPVEASQQIAGCGQSFGVQNVPSPCDTLGDAHPCADTNVHAPVAGLQHASGCGHTIVPQVVPEPCQRRVPIPTHTDCVSVAQYVPSIVLQHAPTGAHGSLSQLEPTPWNVDPSVHEACTTVVHTLFALLQHAPGCGHGSGVHEATKAWNVTPLPHDAAPTVVEHAPVVLSQHTPAHGTGLHVVPLPWNAPVHPVELVIVQAVAPQHAPPHGLGEQTDPVPWYTPVHEAGVHTDEQLPSAAQHAPAPTTTCAHDDVEACPLGEAALNT
jgi:hypothetical protein